MPSNSKTSRKNARQGNILHQRYLEKMDQVNRAMQGKSDLGQVMKDVLDSLLVVFECDRAWLVYPCDPESPTWRVPMERTRPEYPGVLPIGVELPLDPVGAEVYRILREADGPVQFGPGGEHPVPHEMAEGFQVQSFLAMAFYPRIGKPWSFGLHQCSYARIWDEEDKRLFQEIGRRLSDVLTSLLAYQNLEASEQELKHLIDSSPVAMLVSSGADEHVEWINNKFVELFGYTIEDMPDVEHWWPLAYPDPEYRKMLEVEWHDRVTKAIEGRGQIDPVEADVTCKDGSLRHIEFRMSSIGEKHLITFMDLTEHKRMEEAVRASETELRTLISAMTDVIFVGNSEGRYLKIIETNPSLLYKPSQDLLGKTLHEVFPKDQADFFLNHLREALATQKSVNFEYSLSIDDKKMWFYATATPISDDQTLMVARDITSRKLAEEALQERERHSQSLLRLSKRLEQAQTYTEVLNAAHEEVRSIIGYQNLWVYLLTEDRKYAHALVSDGVIPDTVMSEEWAATLSIQGDRMLEEIAEAKDIVVVEDARTDERTNKEIVAQIGNRTIVNVPIFFFEKHLGSVGMGTFGSEGVRVPSESEKEYLKAMASHMAVSLDRVHLLNERKRAEESLRESEEKYRLLHEHAGVGIGYYKPNGEIISFNQMAARHMGGSPEDFNEKSIYDIFPKQEADFYMDRIKRSLTSETAFEYEDHLTLPSGEKWFLSLFAKISDIQGNIVGVQIISQDITERKRAEEEEHRLNRELRAISNCNQTLMRAVDEQTLLNDICRIVCDEAGYRLAWVGYAEHDEARSIRPVAWDGANSDFISDIQLSWADNTENGSGATGVAIRSGEAVYVQDISTDPRTAPWRELLLGYGYRSNIALPLKDDKANVFGVMGIYSEEVNAFTPGEIRLLEELAGDLAFGITALRTRARRERAEAELRASEERFRTFVEKANDIVYTISPDGVFTYVSPNWKEILGHETSEVEGQLFELFIHPDDLAACRDVLRRAIHSSEKISGIEYRVKHKDGSWRWHTSNASVIRDADNNTVSYLGIARDITEKKRVEEALWKSSQMWKLVLENMPAFVFWKDRHSVYLGCNYLFAGNAGLKSIEDIVGLTDFDLPWKNTEAESYRADDRLVMETGLPKLNYEETQLTADGRVTNVRTSKIPLRGLDGEIIGVLGTFEDITELKQMEQDLIAREREYRVLLENIPDLIVRYDKDLRRIYVNPAWEKASGLSADEVIGIHPRDVPRVPAPMNNEYFEKLQRALNNGIVQTVEFTWVNAYGAALSLEYIIVPEFDQHGNINGALSVGRDITERKHHEREREVIVVVSAALRKATTRTEILNVILDQLVSLFDADGATLVLPNARTGGYVDEMGRGIIGERMIGLSIPPGKGVCNWVIQNRQPYMTNHADQDEHFYRPDLLGDSRCIAAVPLIARDLVIGALWIARQAEITEQDLRLLNAIADIAANAIHRVILNEQTEQQLHHLTALHQIDVAITTNFDLNVTLNLILSNVREELEVDAASVLLLDPVTHTLDYASGLGFHTRNIERSHVGIGVGCAGRAALEYRTISCRDLTDQSGPFSRSSLLAGEGFEVHYATPLVVKGQVKGVLEVFHRRGFDPNTEWIDYFETLATQAAIAIESASLMENLQRSNSELMLAYDATIEGWSRALDLRDRETEGHTQRVADMALKLAERMGMSNGEKQDLWRGALLHDIGKMGIPDAILHKPGKLTDPEWEIMRQHPVYAYNMLAPITYLRHALDISYCHHEKWDGSGYPRGLKGEEIPLTARVFAVVDVFDALTSDRPYRKAWPKEKVYEYIREQAGKQFDPKIVSAFLESKLAE